MKKKIFALEQKVRPEYDLVPLPKGAVRGKPATGAQKPISRVLLEPDVAAAFPTPEAVNNALRLVMQLAEIPSEAGKSIANQPRA